MQIDRRKNANIDRQTDGQMDRQGESVGVGEFEKVTIRSYFCLGRAGNKMRGLNEPHYILDRQMEIDRDRQRQIQIKIDRDRQRQIEIDGDRQRQIEIDRHRQVEINIDQDT